MPKTTQSKRYNYVKELPNFSKVVTIECVVPAEDYEDIMSAFSDFQDYVRQYGACSVLKDQYVHNQFEEAMQILDNRVAAGQKEHLDI